MSGFANPFDLSGRNVLLVGASSGIGRATAALANGLGANVILSSRTKEKLEAVAAELPHPSSARIAAFDYLDAASIEVALKDVESIDHVVISAVADENAKRGKFAELSDKTMHASFDKFWGQVNVLRAVSGKLSERGSATLFASIAGTKPSGRESGLSIMNGVQAAVMQTGKSLAVELAPFRVNILAPGVVLTNVWTDEERQNLSAWMRSDLPVRAEGRPEYIAQAAISLMLNPYITGVVLPVDGGLMLT